MADISYLTLGQVNSGLSTINQIYQQGSQLYNSLQGAAPSSTGVKLTVLNTSELAFSGVCGNEPSMSDWSKAWGQASPTEQGNIAAQWRRQFPARPFLPLSQGFVTQAFSGGSNCKVDTGDDTTLYNMVSILLQRSKGVISAGTVAPPAPSSDVANLGDELNKIWDAIKGTANNIATATVAGAVTGARTSTAAANTGSGFAVGGTLLGPALLVAGGVAFVMLMRKR